MAITGTDRGTGSNNTANTSWTLSPGSNFTTYGSWAVLCIASDNAQNSPAGGTQSITVTDSLGNIWTRRVTASADPGAANAGQECAIYTTPQNAGLLQTGTTITVTQEDSTTAKTWTLMEIIPTSDEFALSFVQAGNGTATTTTSPTVTTASITNGNMLVATVALEGGTTQVITQDGDSTNGTWSTQQVSQVGTTTSGSCCASQRKVVTATATQTYNPTLSINADAICGWVEITETAISPVDLIQDGGILPFSR